MKDLIPFEHPVFGQVRIIMVDGEPMWVASDVARALGYANPAEAVQDNCKKVNKITLPSPELGKPPLNLNIVPESDLYALKQFWAWANDRYDVPPVKWPKIGRVEMAFRDTVDAETQGAIINDIKAREPFRVWLCIKWLATYIAIRPGEMRSLTEGQVDRARGYLIISDKQAKEKRAKIIPLVEEDLEIVRALPLAFSSDMPFFRHECGGKLGGKAFGHDQLYRSWRRACRRLGIEGVSLYPGTKHSTAMAARKGFTPEQIMAQTLHSSGPSFRRYFKTGGEDLRELYEAQKSLRDAKPQAAAGKRLVNQTGEAEATQVFNFTKK